MTTVYINYPNPHFSRHLGTAEEFFRHHTEHRRLVRFHVDTLGAELRPFIEGSVDFGATAQLNDMWLELDFDDPKFEQDLADFIQRLLGSRYAPLRNAVWKNRL